jgi:hypothetical protein
MPPLMDGIRSKRSSLKDTTIQYIASEGAYPKGGREDALEVKFGVQVYVGEK